MLVIPKEKPVVENLNSFYLDIRKLFEHYQGELGSGAVHFKSPSAEAVVFFDKGKEVERVVGFKLQSYFEEAIETLFPDSVSENPPSR